MRDLQREHIAAVLYETGGHTYAAAAILGISRSQVYRRMQELGIRPSAPSDSSRQPLRRRH